jgi:S-adenosyl-L-methionine hydrolase (adenosine-forming)
VSLITLITDFGLADEYVGVMKGVMLSIHPQADIIDISHEIGPQNIRQAADMLASAYPYFPAGTIHVVVVDPGVGTDRRIVCLQKKGYRFLAPDNGVLTRVLDHGSLDAAWWVENPAYWLDPVSRTFHGRDIFAPVAAHLSKGLERHRLGRELDPSTLVRLADRGPGITEKGDINGCVITVDRFGNLITNIDTRLLSEINTGHESTNLTLEVAGQRVSGLSLSYDTHRRGQTLVLINSRGYLEIAVNKGSAAEVLQVGVGEVVKVRSK